MLCRAIPYEGSEPYIFLSYCHKDSAWVYPLLEKIVMSGFRVWYDDGNHPGDDWPENIAQHLNNSRVCLVVLTPNAANSHNCRNEINFAVEVEKKIVAVMAEDFTMPLGMQMQLASTHFLKKSTYPSMDMMLGKLYDVQEMQDCRTTPGSIAMRQPESSTPAREDPQLSAQVQAFISHEQSYYQEQPPADQPEEAPAGSEPEPPVQAPPVPEEDPPVPEANPEEAATIPEADCEASPEEEPVPGDSPAESEAEAQEAPAEKQPEQIPENGPGTECLKDETAAPPPVQTPPVPEHIENLDTECLKPKQTEDPEPNPVVFTTHPEEESPSDSTKLLIVSPSAEEEGTDKTVLLPSHDNSDEDRTIQAAAYREVILISLSGKQGYVLRSGHIKMGRSEKKCDVVIPDNLFISSHHADIFFYGGHYYLKDAGSINGTYINDEILESGSRVLLSNPACFRLHEERFILITGDAAQNYIKLGSVYFLRNVQTQEIKLLTEGTTVLNRSHIWPGGTLGDLGISRRQHAEVHLRQGKLYLEDKGCRNGVLLNIRRLEENETCALESKDAITLGSTTLEVGIIAL